MGYYTRHTVTKRVDNDYQELDDDEIKALAELSGYNEEDLTGEGESIKWYDCDTDMIDFSKQHPGVEYRIEGEGDNSEDIWVWWVKDGQIQKWELEVQRPEFPPEDW